MLWIFWQMNSQKQWHHCLAPAFVCEFVLLIPLHGSESRDFGHFLAGEDDREAADGFLIVVTCKEWVAGLGEEVVVDWLLLGEVDLEGRVCGLWPTQLYRCLKWVASINSFGCNNSAKHWNTYYDVDFTYCILRHQAPLSLFNHFVVTSLPRIAAF